ncbi:hypothetical protein [Actinacidiphila acidipaludis]|uniref:Translation initiation factor IF-2 n=1 Tax=Actinacidiphila acidipaludis TaxID=2873382 RepID=A0ABS7Q6J8_9ACTN|nr:hypothetical protein [Streptomyces acidipaludis]MBY8878070.1 hypothetical protein [Streptomyces acidipaludis]
MDALHDHEVLDGQWDDGVPDGQTNGHDRYDTCDDEVAQADWEDELPRLMARLGQLIALHGPAGVVAMARTEAERRELNAYAAGWQDAAAEFTPRVAAARRDGWLGRWRPLRVLNGPGDVIPFPVARQYAHPAPHPSADDAVVNGVNGVNGWDGGLDAGHDTGPEADRDRGYGAGRDAAQERGRAPGYDVPQDRGHGPGRETRPDPDPGAGQVDGTARRDVRPGTGGQRPSGPHAHDDSAHGGRDEDEPAHGEEPSATRSHGEVTGRPDSAGQQRAPQPPRPSLPAKSRWSRAPTIPRLAPPQRPPGRGPDGTPPPDGPA